MQIENYEAFISHISMVARCIFCSDNKLITIISSKSYFINQIADSQSVFPHG